MPYTVAQQELNTMKARILHEAADAINSRVQECHISAVAGHWWHTRSDEVQLNRPQKLERNFGELLALIHSEISEAMEGGRKDRMDDHLPHFTSVEVELADALIRIFDLAGALQINLGEAFVQKFMYNQTRQDHKIEERMKPGGKEF